MLRRLTPEAFRNWCAEREQHRPWQEPALRAQVTEVIEAVRQEGDAALLRFTERFDGVDLSAVGGIEVEREELLETAARAPRPVVEAIRAAAGRLRRFHAAQRTADVWIEDEDGNQIGQLQIPLDRVGVYVPGGRAAYPSSVLMGLIPAGVAGVGEKLIATPPGRDGRLLPAVAAACLEGGADRVFRVGGAQAVAALALGTALIPAVDLIVGPGNAYVTCAKALLQDRVAIDGLAGPTEICIIADAEARPEWVAGDLLAQAEHEPLASPVLISTSSALLDAVDEELALQLDGAPRREIAEAALRGAGAAVLADSLEQAVELADRMAPEHLSLQVTDPEEWLPWVRHAGAVFLGGSSPVAAGDYAAGSNHVLPTGGTARFSSGLNLHHFRRRMAVVAGRPGGSEAWAAASITLAEAEGFAAHAASLRMRGEEGERSG